MLTNLTAISSTLAGVGGRSTTLSTCSGELSTRPLIWVQEQGVDKHWLDADTFFSLPLVVACDAAKCLGGGRGGGTLRGGAPT